MAKSPAVQMVELLWRSGEGLDGKVAIEEQLMQDLLEDAREVLLKGGSYVEMPAPVTVVGDIHGQFNDLVQIFKALKPPGNGGRYLFLGDYVDRGKYSLETICLLLAYKVLYPSDIHLLRGDHECASVNRIYGFYDDCKRRYNVKLWKQFVAVFNCLPLAGCVGERIFCVHGGLAYGLKTVDSIKRVALPVDLPGEGLVSELLWAQPVLEVDVNTRTRVPEFTPEDLQRFLAANGFDLVVRAHQVVEGGYEFFSGKQLVTIFSAPQYCGEFDNFGAVMHVDVNLTCSMHVLKPSSVPR